MSWTTFYRRSDVLRAVIAAADERLDSELPMDVVGVRETFGDPMTLLAALQLKWHTRLAGRLERDLSAEPMDLEATVVAAWCACVDELPGTRMMLDRYRLEPLDETMARAMTRAAAKEHVLLAVSAGRAALQDRGAAAVGVHLEALARSTRSGLPTPAPGADGEEVARERASFLDRLRTALAA